MPRGHKKALKATQKKKNIYIYVVQSKSNATDEIKQKLLFVHKNVFLWNFPRIYCRSENTFQWPPITAGSRRRTGLWSQNAWPQPRSSSQPPWSAWWLTADSFLWVAGNILLGTDQAKKWGFGKPSSRRRPTRWALRRRRECQIWSLLADFSSRPSFSCRMLKIVLTEPDGLIQELWQWQGILLNTLTATAATRSWIVLIFLKIPGGPDHRCFCWP